MRERKRPGGQQSMKLLKNGAANVIMTLMGIRSKSEAVKNCTVNYPKLSFFSFDGM